MRFSFFSFFSFGTESFQKPQHTFLDTISGPKSSDLAKGCGSIEVCR
jgi:hypothetical protein